MSGSLAAQLQALREAGGGSKQKTNTFLYDPREAALIDDETLYNLAWNGLLELKQLDAKFDQFDNNTKIAQLFSRQRIHFHRAQVTKQEDQELNATLATVLDALSGYFLLPATHKVLEFLVRRYEIHRYNVDRIMAMIISYHESPWFAKMVRILHIHNTRWEFLLQVKTHGEPLLRAALVQRALDDSSVVEFIFEAATRIGASNTKIISLYTLVTLEMLETAQVREEMLRWLIPHLLEALKAKTFPELQASAYMIITKLASKAILTERVVDTLVKYLVKYVQSGTQMNALLCMIYIAQTQPSFRISKGVGKYVVQMEGIAEFLGDAAANYESTTFVHLLALYLIDEMSANQDASHKLLQAMIDNLTTVDEFAEELAEKLLERAQAEEFNLESESVKAFGSALVTLGKKHVSKVDAAVTTITMIHQEKKMKKRMNKFLMETFGNVTNSAHFLPSHTDAKTSLAVALDHATEHTRYQALGTLEQHYKTTESTEGILINGNVLLRRLLDDSERIVKFVSTSSLGDLLLDICPSKKVFETLVQVTRKWSFNLSVLDAVMNFMLEKFRKAMSDHMDAKILVLLLTFIPVDSEQTKNVIPFEKVWSWVVKLDHQFSVAATELSTTNNPTLQALMDCFGRTLAGDIQGLLPYCLGWSQPTEVNTKPLTQCLIETLYAARKHLLNAKNSKEQQLTLDQSFRFILKKEFVRVCEQPVSNRSKAWVVRVANMLCEVARDTFVVSRDDFDSCVGTLLQSPSPVFIDIQTCLLGIFHDDLEHEILPTMARLATSRSDSNDVLLLLAKSRSLDIISAILEGFQGTDSEQELKQVVYVVPSVLVALSDPHKTVRQSALTCIDRWIASGGDLLGSAKSKDLQSLYDVSVYLLQAKQDILMDLNAVTTLCGVYGNDRPKESVSFYQLLMNFVTSARSDEITIGVKLLNLLSHVKDSTFWAQSIDYFQQTLAGFSGQQQEAKLLNTFLDHYLNTETAVVKFERKQPVISKVFLDALLAVLQSDKGNSARLQQIQLFALSHLTSAYYEALDDVSQHVLVNRLLTLLMAADEAVVSQLIHCLSALPLKYEIFIRLLEQELTVKINGANSKAEITIQELSCILEVLAVKVDSATSSNESPDAANTLLRTLCTVLELFCSPQYENVVSDYILQVLFGCLRRVCEVSLLSHSSTVVPTKKSRNQSVAAEPEILVKHTLDCLGRTSSPQTRNEALLFISSLVNLHPVSVLKSLEKILSFVSAGSVNQDDEYSFHVLETIVKSAVPHILEERETKLISPQQFIRIFVDAYDQIPSRRRESLFNVLMEALGKNLLPYCVVALVQKSVEGDEQTDLTAFAHQLCFTFDCSVQISSLVMILRMARDLLPNVIEDSDTDTDELDDEEEEIYEQFSFNAQLIKLKSLARQLNTALVAFVSSHLQARELHHKILNVGKDDDTANEEEEDQLQQNYLMLAQVVLLYFRRVAREQSLHEDDGFWTSLAAETIEILSALQQLLSTPGFVAVISELLHHENSLVRKKAMQLFNERLQEERNSLTSGEELLFVDMLDELDVILQNADGSENSANIQTALLSVDILARNFALDHSKRFQKCLPTIVKYVDVDAATATSTTLHLMGCAFVCISSICRMVGPLVFPLLPKFFPKLLAAIDFCSGKTRDADEKGVKPSGMNTVLQCLLASLEVFTDKIPQFLAPYLSKIVQSLLAPTLLSTKPSNAQVLLSVDCSLLNLCNHVELRHLLPNLFGVYEHALRQGDLSVEKLFSIVSTVITSLDAPSLRQYLPAFARFFVVSLDARRVHSRELQDVDAVEDDILECLVQFILKLSEKQLKPLFLKIFEWAQAKLPGTGGDDISRRIVFFKLLVKLSERLRGIFVPYYAHVLEFLARALQESRLVLTQKKLRSIEGAADASSSEDEDDFFAVETKEPPTKKTKMSKTFVANGKVVDEIQREAQLVLLRTTIHALSGCFVHDSDGFMEKERFDMVMTPLVDVFDILKYADGSVKTFMFDVVAPCVANLAWAAKSDILWKPLHYAVLMKSRSDCAAIRLATLKTVEKCYQVIGDEFLAMLPESIPFLAELMEDNDPEVEHTCHAVIKQIEEISGESLDQYLTS